MVGAAVGITAVQWGCFVNRQTDKYQCTTQAQCMPMGRVCEMGYCVIDPFAKFDAAVDAYIPDSPVCPLICNGGCTYNGPTWTCTINGPVSNPTCPPNYHCAINCSDTAQCTGVITCSTPSCNITCMGDNACGAISCSGDACSIHCSTSVTGGACGNVTCSSGTCDETCNGSAACGDLTCSGAACTATCSGMNACGNVTCTGATACDVTCNSGAPACGNMTCGTGKCTESCTGTGACGFQMCQNSCNCNTTCIPTTAACGAMTCPTVGMNKYCATGMVVGNPCNSGVFSQCKSCF